MAGVSTRSLAVRALLALLLVSGSLTHVLAKENIDDLEKDGAAIDNLRFDPYGRRGGEGSDCSNYGEGRPPGVDLESEECQYDQCRVECNLDFQDCLDNPSDCTHLELWGGTGYTGSRVWYRLTGTMPTELGLLTELTSLELGYNWLTGTMPTELGLLTDLSVIMFGGNLLLTGTMPTELGLLADLTTMQFDEGLALTGTMPTELGLMTSLTVMYLDENLLTGTMPTELGTMRNIEYLRLEDNLLTGTMPTELGLLTEAWGFRLDGNAGLCGDVVSPVDRGWIVSSSRTALGTACDPSVDKDNRNGIMRAAVSGDTTSLAVALADAKQNIDLVDNTALGFNALMLAAQYDHQDVARVLLDAGANTGLLTYTRRGEQPPGEENNWSNVMVAAWYGDQEILSMFLDASLEHLNTPCDNKQMTPLHAAVSQDHCNTAAILINAAANDECDAACAASVCSDVASCGACAPTGVCAPCAACTACYAVLEADPTNAACSACTACTPCAQCSDCDCDACWGDDGGDDGDGPPSCLDALDSDGKTPLHYAAKNGNYKCLMTLMHAGADASIEDGMGNTAYTLAQAGDHQDVMTALSISGYLLRSVARLFGPKA